MLALVVDEPGAVSLRSRPELTAGPGELLVRPDLVGLCGTDREIIDGDINPGFIRYPRIRTIALLAVAMLRLWSAAEVVVLGRRAGQPGLAASAGADSFVTTPGAAGRGDDLVLEAAGVTAADEAVTNDLTITGSFSYTAAAWRSVVTLLNAGQFRPGFLTTHRFELRDWQAAVAALGAADSPAAKSCSLSQRLGAETRA